MPPAPSPRFWIGDLAAQAGVNPKTIRYYEAIGLMGEPKRLPNGYRIYANHDLARLVFIRRPKHLGSRRMPFETSLPYTHWAIDRASKSAS